MHEHQKGGISLSSTGYIRVNAYTSRARIPLRDVAISVTATDGTAIATRLTDRNGLIAQIAVPVPDLSAGLTPDTGVQPFTQVNLYARLEGYEQQENENLQVFPDTITTLDLEMIPISELPESYKKINVFDTPRQNL